jgi:hypothetical protein
MSENKQQEATTETEVSTLGAESTTVDATADAPAAETPSGAPVRDRWTGW